AVAPFQGGTGEDGTVPLVKRLAGGGAEPVEPGPAVLVLQGNPRAHLRLVFRRVEVVALEKKTVDPLGQSRGDGALAAARDAHDNEKTGIHAATEETGGKGRRAAFISFPRSPRSRSALPEAAPRPLR